MKLSVNKSKENPSSVTPEQIVEIRENVIENYTKALRILGMYFADTGDAYLKCQMDAVIQEFGNVPWSAEYLSARMLDDESPREVVWIPNLSAYGLRIPVGHDTSLTILGEPRINQVILSNDRQILGNERADMTFLISKSEVSTPSVDVVKSKLIDLSIEYGNIQYGIHHNCHDFSHHTIDKVMIPEFL